MMNLNLSKPSFIWEFVVLWITTVAIFSVVWWLFIAHKLFKILKRVLYRVKFSRENDS